MQYYVDAAASRSGDGSRNAPFKWIDDAARVAVAGDEVIVRPGIYREHVIPRHPGKPDAPVIFRSEVPLGAVITGAEPLRNWVRLRGNLWSTEVSNSLFGNYNPYTTRVYGDWYFSPSIRHTGSVFLNGQMMYEADSLEACEAGAPDPFSWVPEESVFQWFTCQRGEVTVLYGNFQGKDPNEENVEFSVRRNCFMPEVNGIDYITVSGFDIRMAATTWAPPAAYQDGMIGPHWSLGWTIEDCEIHHSRCCGISLGKYLDPENDMYFTTRHVKSPTQMERDAVCRGQYHGWLKERVGSHLIRRCHIHHCEQTGIVGRMGGVFSTIEDCHIHHICNSQQLGGAETAGIKLHAAIDVTIRRNHLHHCIIGVWCDWEAQGTRITQNLMHDNMRPEGTPLAKGAMFSADVFIEVSHGPTLIDNNLLLSRVSLSMPSQGIACLHNLMLGSFSLINSGVDSIVNGQREPRYTPYHIRHRTEVAGFMTLLHGDDRILNNIFIQYHPVTHPELTPQDNSYEVVGTAPFDIFPGENEWISRFMMGQDPDMHALASAHFDHLPVWISGNAYLNGATVSTHEPGARVVSGELVQFRFEETPDGVLLHSNLGKLLDGMDCPVLSTSVLGTAFEPEQPFEAPDGSPLVFSRDYFDAHRGACTLPGPFASPVPESLNLTPACAAGGK